nr:cadmium-binding heptapeptide - downy thornapple [Datura inoxia]
ECECECG